MYYYFWQVVTWFNYIVFGYFLVFNAVYLYLSIIAFRDLRKYARRLKSVDMDELINAAGAPPITLLVPSFNEEVSIVDATKSLLALQYPEYEIIIVNDGSTDSTIERLTEAYDLRETARYPTADLPAQVVDKVYKSRRHDNLWVLDKQNGGKSDALNAGINYCRMPLFCALDADNILERDALIRVARPFLEDATTIASGGIVRVANGCTVKDGQITNVELPNGTVAAFQVLEYLRSFLAGRVGWNTANAGLIISGAFGLFRRSIVVEAGGYDIGTIGEDMELTIRLHRHCREKDMPYRITFVPDPVVWTEVPDTLKILGKQRDRWQRGLLQSTKKHRKMMFRPRYGKIGLLAFPYLYLFEMIGPVVETMGYIIFVMILIIGNPSAIYVVTFILLAFFFGISFSIASVGLEELVFRRYKKGTDLIRLFWLAIAENFGYRQLTVFWRLRGIYSYLRKREGWGTQERKGFDKEEEDTDDKLLNGESEDQVNGEANSNSTRERNRA